MTVLDHIVRSLSKCDEDQLDRLLVEIAKERTKRACDTSFYRFYFAMSSTERAEFAQICGSTPNRMGRVARGYEPASPQLCVAIDRESHGQVHYATVNDEWTMKNVGGDGRKRIPMDWAYVENKARANASRQHGGEV